MIIIPILDIPHQFCCVFRVQGSGFRVQGSGQKFFVVSILEQLIDKELYFTETREVFCLCCTTDKVVVVESYIILTQIIFELSDLFLVSLYDLLELHQLLLYTQQWRVLVNVDGW